jgi:hypothetical protein
LRDSEEELTVAPRRVDLSARPPARDVDRAAEVMSIHARGQAHVETHRDVRPEPALDVGRALGCEPGLVAVVDRSERDAIVVERGDRVAEREDLEAAGVREDRTAPAREAVDAPELLDDLLARAEVEVVGVREDHVGAERADLVGMQ